jgi:hypothetical protein
VNPAIASDFSSTSFPVGWGKPISRNQNDAKSIRSELQAAAQASFWDDGNR